ILTERFFLLKRAVTALLLLGCIAAAVLDREIGKAPFALTGFLLLVHLAEELQRQWHKSGYPDCKEHVTRTAPFFLAVCLAVYLIPAPAEPYDWQPVRELCHRIALFSTRVYGSLTHPSEEYSKIGFSDQGAFGAALAGNEEEVLLLHTDQPSIRHYALVGCISGEFTGREWIFDTGIDGCSRMTDTIETACAVRKFTDSFQTDYLQKAAMQYEVRFYNTQYLFSPAKIKLESTRDKTPGISEKNGSIVSKKRLQYQDTYTVLCYVLNYSNPQLPALLDTAAPITEEEWNKTANAEKALNKPGYTYADYQNYRQAVYRDYCHSYPVSEQVQALLDGIRSDASGRYETLKALEACLNQMEYSTDCGPLPESVTDAGSYLDYFLFTSRKGYCMHYATAFVLMANEMGIPCRYVQGYNVRRDSSGAFLVTQDNAHAWPEAYFDHVGWVAFEPTPGYTVQEGWSRAEGSPRQPEPVPEASVPESSTEPGSLPEPEAESAGIRPLLFLVPCAGLIGFLLLWYCIRRLLSRRKYRRMQHAAKFRYLTQQSLRLLGYLGFRRETDETLSEFLERMQHSDRQDIKPHLGFLPVYEAVLYSDREVTEAELLSAETTYRQLYALVRKSSLKHRFQLLLLR
ncbi:MAG: hypothetical protein IKN55_12100, partial [Oscillospiraceae bacterium]|nr:hypothetical protein [Oscillospiraceae bacterium]